MKRDVGSLYHEASFHGVSSVMTRSIKIKTEFIYNICETEREICGRSEQSKRHIEQDKQSLLGNIMV